MEHTNTLSVISCDQVTKCVVLFRKHTNLGVAEIKYRIEQGLPLLVFDSLDETGLDTILRCYRELNKLGAKAKLTSLGDEVPLQYFKNVKHSWSETAKEIHDRVELELGSGIPD